MCFWVVKPSYLFTDSIFVEVVIGNVVEAMTLLN